MNGDLTRIAERGSRLPAVIRISDLVHLRPYVESLLDPNWIRSELGRFDEWVEANSEPVAVMQLGDRPPGCNLLIAMLWSARRWDEESARDPTAWYPALVKRLTLLAVSLLVTEFNAGPFWTPDAREYMRQRLQSENEFWSISHECEVFAVFVRKGTSPVPHFLTKASPTEIETRWRGVLVPVQCKAKRPIAGRFMSKDLFTRLAVAITVGLRRQGRRSRVRITVGSPEAIMPDDIEPLREAVLQLPDDSDEPAVIRRGARRFELRAERAADRVDSWADAERYLDGLDLYISFILADPAPVGGEYNVSAVVGISTERSDSAKQVSTLRKSIREATRQLRGGPPGLACIHFFNSDPYFGPGEPLPRWIRYVIEPFLAQNDHLLGVIISSDTNLTDPDATGLIHTRPVVKEYLLPPDYPLGEPF